AHALEAAAAVAAFAIPGASVGERTRRRFGRRLAATAVGVTDVLETVTTQRRGGGPVWAPPPLPPGKRRRRGQILAVWRGCCSVVTTAAAGQVQTNSRQREGLRRWVQSERRALESSRSALVIPPCFKKLKLPVRRPQTPTTFVSSPQRPEGTRTIFCHLGWARSFTIACERSFTPS